MFLFLLLAALPLPALANGGGYIYGTSRNSSLGLYQPKNAEQVEMQTELLNIDLGVERATVEVEYTLHNPGKAVTVEAAFPCMARLEQWTEDTVLKPAPPLEDFSITADGTALKTRVEHDIPAKRVKATPFVVGGRPVSYWYAFKVDFKAGQTRTVRASYHTAYAGEGISVSDSGSDQAEVFTYLFSTAAVWKGPIQSGKVTVRAAAVDPEQVRFNLPKRFKRAGNLWTWEFQDFEPGKDDDLSIVVNPAREFKLQHLPGTEDKEGNAAYVNYVGVGNRWEMHHRLYKVKASSTLPSAGENNYEAEHVREYSGGAWAEGAADDGLGESLTLTLLQPRKLSHLAIRNGYLKGEGDPARALYFANNRVAELGISINGAKPFTAHIPDEPLARSYYRIPLPADAPEVKTVQLTIEKVYRGTKHRDTCISGIELITPLGKKPKLTPVR